MTHIRKHTKIKTPLSLSLVTLTIQLCLGTQHVQAQQTTEESAKAVEKISVLGSRRIGRTIEDSPVPIDIIGAEALTSTGQTETNMILGSLLPSFNFPQPSVTDGTDHVRPAQLRGLAPDHTLVLINGKRRHSNALLNLNGSSGRGSSAVDLNAIPANAIERIEVLRDGAAAQYGSDAIAGVINVVLKSADNGGTASISYGANVTTMAGVPELDSVDIGADGNLVFNEGGGRDITDGQTLTLRTNLGLLLGENGFVNLSTEFRDRRNANRADYDPRENYSRLDDGTLDPRELTVNRYNHNFGNGEVKDFSLFINAGLPLNDNTELYAFGSYSARDGEGGGFYRRAQDSRNIKAIYPDGFLPTITSDISDYSIASGVKGDISDWDYDFSAVYGLDKFNFGVINSLNTSLGPTSQTEFDAGSLIYDQLTINADINRLIDINAFASDLNVAFGAEYRREGYEVKAGEPNSYIQGPFGRGGAVVSSADDRLGAAGSQVFPGFTPASAGNNNRNSVSLYVDLEADITDKWNVAIAGRFEDYSDFGSTFNAKLSNRYVINDEVALRASVSSGFRAPSLQQQYFTSIATVFVEGEPTETGTFSPDSAVARALGSPGLDAEDSINYSAGFTYSPDSNLDLTVDFYRIEIDDRIVLSNNLSGAAIEQLLQGTGANRARFFLNAIDSVTQGVDIVSSYAIDISNGADLVLNAGVNYNSNEVKDTIAPPSVLQVAGFDQNNLFSDTELRRFEKSSPQTKVNLSAVYSNDGFRTTVRAVRYGETHDPSNNPDNYEILPAKWVTDFDMYFPITEQLNFTVGVNNVFDEYPDPTRELITDATGFSRIFAYSGFSPFGFTGRYMYAKVGISF